MTAANTPSAAEASRPAPVAPSWSWALRRTVLGLAIMFAVTGLAAYIANASIDPAADGIDAQPTHIGIGTPAAPLVQQSR